MRATFLPPYSLELWRKERAKRQLSFRWKTLILIGHYGIIGPKMPENEDFCLGFELFSWVSDFLSCGVLEFFSGVLKEKPGLSFDWMSIGSTPGSLWTSRCMYLSSRLKLFVGLPLERSDEVSGLSLRRLCRAAMTLSENKMWIWWLGFS